MFKKKYIFKSNHHLYMRKLTTTLIFPVMLVCLFSCREKSNSALTMNESTSSESKDSFFLKLPTKSQFGTTSQTIGVSDVSVYYYRPNVNDRVIWGNIVKWDSVWRTGAERGTVFHFDDDVNINGKSLPKGDYSFFIIPRVNNNWTIIFNKASSVYGNNQYDEKDDVLRFDVKASDHPLVETMTIDIADVKDTEATVAVLWEKKAVDFKVAYDANNTVWKRIEEQSATMENAPDSVKWINYISIANYCVYSNNKDKADYAMGLIDKSLQMKQSFENLKLKSDLFALKGNIDSAIVYAKKTHKLGETPGMLPREVADMLEENILKYEETLKTK